MKLDLKVPPPLVLVIAGAAMYAAARLTPALSVHAFGGQRIFAALFAASGVLLVLPAVLRFRRADTTVSPLSPEKASTLVTAGVYAYTRNPMYLGLLLILIGWAMYLANATALLMLPAFVAYISRYQIRPEEEALSEKFGEAFLAYMRRVRRWL
ncbi:MAG: isoprenylcysteine carboxylmethyltransferase family protein [Steroidobacteraceae bacterium]